MMEDRRSRMIEVLREVLPVERVLTGKEDLIPYGFDGTPALQKLPLAVVFPETGEEVAEILKRCRANRVAVVTRGSGTGLSGGSIPVADSVVLCTLRMRRILEVDERNLTLLAEPGVTTLEIDQAAARCGLFYPPDPGSMKVSTIGGNVANNSGGLRGLKYGVTRDYVMGMEVVTADGERMWLGSKCVKDVAGYSLRDLFIGSEGTLGVITKVLLKLVPRPAAKKTLLATYQSMADAAGTVSAIIAAKLIPCTVEFLDQRTIRCVEDYARIGLPTDCQALLFIESDGHPAAVADEMREIEAITRNYRAVEVTVAQDEAEGERLALARRNAFSALARLRPTTILEDATVPRSELARMIEFVSQTAEKYRLDVATFGHFGDGNLHPTFLTDERDHAEMARVHEAFREIMEFAISLGGTVTGEHGIGLAKKDFLPVQFDEGSFRLLKTIKKALDPDHLLNPGKIFDR